ncbi:hypothetical protein NIES4106_38420 [Fischerella sp. NIES-4106]|nr:hypothetical protein NIES4106_38420 [Fischerella sp. NIES-4106]
MLNKHCNISILNVHQVMNQIIKFVITLMSGCWLIPEAAI